MVHAPIICAYGRVCNFVVALCFLVATTTTVAASAEVVAPADGWFNEPSAVALQSTTSTVAVAAKSWSLVDLVNQATNDIPQAQHIEATASGAHITCSLQTMGGDLTRDGLNLVSTKSQHGTGAWSVRVDSVGRSSSSPMSDLTITSGVVHVTKTCATLVRSTVSEEVSTNAGGIRQDFIVHQRPAGAGDLVLAVRLPGAAIDSVTPDQVAITLDSGRSVVWHGLRVNDAQGRPLVAAFASAPHGVAISVDDADAVYPIRIDPTFTDANWVSVGGAPGIVGDIYAAVIYNGDLVVGGRFHLAGTTEVKHVARWNGSRWSPIDLGANNIINALAVSGNNLYAGGYFTAIGGVSANYIAKWNGSVWSALSSGMNSVVYTITASGNDVYAGGAFGTSGGLPTNGIAKWNGSAWSALGSGFSNGHVNALAASGGVVYAGGTFTAAGTVSTNRIAKWDGSTWSSLGTGMSGTYDVVYAMALSSSGDLYVGGDFIVADGVTVNRIGKWNGSVWTALAGGVSNRVLVVQTSGADVYVGGIFSSSSGTGPAYISKWHEGAWSPLGSGISGSVTAMAISDGKIFACGSVYEAGGIPVNSVAKFDGTSWSSLGLGTNGQITGIACSGTDVYVVGDFTTIAGTPAAHIAKWNGSAWSALGSGLNGNATAVAVASGNLYVVGNFSFAGGIVAFNVAKWNGSAWSALGGGTNGTTTSLAISGNDVYVGGYFSTAGGAPALRIAKWNGSVWSALGSGFDNTVHAIAIMGGTVFAAGDFTNTGTTAMNRIAQWNSGVWSAVGTGATTGTNATTYALATDGSSLYAGGSFTTAGSVSAFCVAKWSGSAWSPLGSGTSSTVRALVCSGSEVYAGGLFLSAGGQTVNNVAKWSEGAWSSVGSGANDPVYALGVSGSDLWAGGIFTTMAGKVSAFIAHTRPMGMTAQSLALTPVATQVYGANSMTLSATATSGLPVALRVTSGPGWLNGNVLTFSGAGTVVVKAEQDGDATFAAAPSATWSILVQPAQLQVTANSVSRIVGTVNPEMSGTILGLVNGDVVTATYSSTANVGTPAGVYGPASAQAITPTVTDVSGRISNYNVILTKGTVNITGSTVQTITIADPGTVTYGVEPLTLSATTTSGLPASLSLISGSATLSGATLTITGAGAVVVAAQQAGDVTYSQATSQRTITVQPAPLLATAHTASRQAGTANPIFTGTLTGVVGSDGITAMYLSSATEVTPAGDYDSASILAITPTLNDPNSRLANYVTTITKGTLTITAISEPPPGTTGTGSTSAGAGGDGSGSGGGGCGLGGGLALIVGVVVSLMWRERRR